MIDLTDFQKYKIIYLCIILLSAFLIVLRTTPSYNDVFVDVIVEPPENVRRTDFSWITVNEWFVTQTRLIKSDTILEAVKSDITGEKLKKIVLANRLGGSNIIRISVHSDEDVEKLKSLVSNIANLYLNQLSKPSEVQAESKITMVEAEGKDALQNERLKIQGNIEATSNRLKDYEAELKILETKPNQLQEIKKRIGEIDNKLVSLKTELEKLRAVYTDEWPPVLELLSQIDALESERQKLDSDLPAAQELEDKKSDIINKIDKDKKNIEALQNLLKAIYVRLGQTQQEETVKEQVLPSKAESLNRIITPPTQKKQRLSPQLGIRLLIATVIGFIFWFLIGLLLKNLYLYWIFKDRIFRKR